jgi:hypothetical protein
MLGTFAAFDVRAGDRAVELSLRWTPRVMLTMFGTALLLGCLALAVIPPRRRVALQRQSPPLSLEHPRLTQPPG